MQMRTSVQVQATTASTSMRAAAAAAATANKQTCFEAPMRCSHIRQNTICLLRKTCRDHVSHSFHPFPFSGCDENRSLFA